MVDEGARILSQLEGDVAADVGAGDPPTSASASTSLPDSMAAGPSNMAEGDLAYPSNNPFAAPIFHTKVSRCN